MQVKLVYVGNEVGIIVNGKLILAEGPETTPDFSMKEVAERLAEAVGSTVFYLAVKPEDLPGGVENWNWDTVTGYV